MFTHEGPARSARKNVVLAWYLAGVAGFVNSGGFVLIGTFTSHVTGSTGRFSIDLANGDNGAAFSAVLLVASFFLGALGAGFGLELSGEARRARAYATVLLVEGTLLVTFVLVAGLSRATHPRARDAEAVLLCIAMGMQNGLVTRLSNAVVRTTHLTGIVTDLAIELAGWYRARRDGTALEEHATQRRILFAIIAAFTLGSALGAAATARASRWAMLVPAFAIWGAAIYSFRTARTDGSR